MIQVDTAGHPAIPFEPLSLVLLVFQFRHNLLFLVVFRVPNFRSRFEALNDIFWVSFTRELDHPIHPKRCGPRIDLSNELLSMSNGDRMPKLRPREVEALIYPTGHP